MNKEKRIKEIDALMEAEKQKGCQACRSIGLCHCAYPEECGVWDELFRLEKEREELVKNLK